MLIASADMNDINSLKKSLNSKFEIKDLGTTKRIIGMEIERDISNRLLHVKQSNYIEKLLKRFNMLDAKGMLTPIVGHFKLSSRQSPRIDEELQFMNKTPYASATGKNTGWQ